MLEPAFLPMPPSPHPAVGWAFTLRGGGVSQGPWGVHEPGCSSEDAAKRTGFAPGGLNLGLRTGDDLSAVRENRRCVAAAIGHPVSWLTQVHGIRVLDLDGAEARVRMPTAARPGNPPGNPSDEVPFDGISAGETDKVHGVVHGTPADETDKAHGVVHGTSAGEIGQAHGVVSGANLHQPDPEADAQITTRAGIALAVQVADCLPVLLADTQGRVIGAAHAGWRGLAGGVLEATVQAMRKKVPDADLVAWLGACIGPAAFEVGNEVRDAFLANIQGDSAAPATIRPASTTMSGSSHLPDRQTSERAPFDMVRQSVITTPNITPPHQEMDQPASAVSAFQPGRAPGKWLANLPLLARLRLRALGITTIHTAGHCTYSEPEHFWSYRRSTPCGRMAGLIWLTADRFPPPIGTLRHHAG